MLQNPGTIEVRYLNSNEHEQLLGYGWGHTLPAMSASQAKSSGRSYEDERLSLLGDSFPACGLFVLDFRSQCV